MSSLVWVIIACVFGVGEMVTAGGFFLAPFAIAAAIAAAAAATVGGAASWVVFVVASLLMLTLVRPLARRHMRQPAQIRTGSAALVGKRATVLERIANDEGVGCVRIDGEIWTARAFDEDHVITEGTQVEVVGIKGATALVME